MNIRNPFAGSTEESVDNRTTEAPLGEDAVQSLATLTAERDQLLADKADLQDRLLRRQAEFDNFRRRSERERAEYFEYAGMETVKQLLPVLDDSERALKYAVQTGSETADKAIHQGVELLYNRLLETLKRLGLEVVSAKGQKFDPHQHEAIERFPTDEAEDETVLEEYQPGYLYKGKLLRPAMVKVAVKP